MTARGSGYGAPGRTYATRRVVLVACCFSLFMAQIDATAVNVALPAIATALHAGPSELQWVVDGFVLVLASLAVSGGALGDRFGRRRVYLTGIAVFTLGSLGCSAAPGVTALVAFRMLQAAGAAMLMPVTLSIIANTFREPAVRARAIGVWTATAGVALAGGPLLGGALTSLWGWRAVFWINLPIGAAAFVLSHRALTESRAAVPRPFDLVGQALVTAAIASLTAAVIGAPTTGWTSPGTIGLLGAAVVAGALLAGWVARAATPWIAPRQLRDPALSGAVMVAVLGYFALLGFLFLNTIYLQRVRGMSPFHAGVTMLPASLALLLAGPLAGRASARHGPVRVLLVATSLLAGVLLGFVWLTPSTPLAVLGAAYFALGASWGLLSTPLTNLAVDAMPREQAGVASATVGASRQLGGVLGVAFMGSATVSRLQALAPTSGVASHGFDVVPAAFTASSHAGYLLGALAALLATAVTLKRLRR